MVMPSSRQQLIIGALGPAAAVSTLVARASVKLGAGRSATAPAAAAAALVAGSAGAAAWLGWDVRRRIRSVERVVDRSDARTARRTDAVVARVESERARVDAAEARVTSAMAARVEESAVLLRESEDRIAARIDVSAADSQTRFDDLPERTLELMEPLVGLTALLSPRAPLPTMRGFAAAGDLMLTYVGEILRRRPRLVVECGSGVSTLVAAYALELVGGDGRVVALEDGPEWVDRTRGFVADHGLEHRAEVRHAPITDVDVNGEIRPWYSTDAVKDLDGIDLLFVDGPVGGLAPMSRYPAVPLLRPQLRPGAVIILDDVGRPDEDRAAHRWVDEWDGMTQTRLHHIKGTAVLIAPQDSPGG